MKASILAAVLLCGCAGDPDPHANIQRNYGRPNLSGMSAPQIEGYLRGERFKKEMEERDARIEFLRSEAELMNRKRNPPPPAAPATPDTIPGTGIPRSDALRELQGALSNYKWCDEHQDGGDITDGNGTSVHFTKEQVEGIARGAQHEIMLWSEMLNRKQGSAPLILK